MGEMTYQGRAASVHRGQRPRAGKLSSWTPGAFVPQIGAGPSWKKLNAEHETIIAFVRRRGGVAPAMLHAFGCCLLARRARNSEMMRILRHNGCALMARHEATRLTREYLLEWVLDVLK